MSDEIERQTVMHLALEMKRAPCMVLEDARPERIFSLVAMLQLALRHPDLDQDGAAAAARSFIRDVLHFYRDYPTMVKVIQMGFDS